MSDMRRSVLYHSSTEDLVEKILVYESLLRDKIETVDRLAADNARFLDRIAELTEQCNTFYAAASNARAELEARRDEESDVVVGTTAGD
jgi:hypothetical protein